MYFIKLFTALYLLILINVDDFGNLIRALVPFEYVEEARAIQGKFKAFLKELEVEVAVIFVPLQLAVSLVCLINSILIIPD